eukprot:1159865-Pelagomonas_calceolata.AAC.12
MQVQPAIPIRISQAVSLEPNVVPEYGAALKQGCRRGKGHQGGSGAEQHINTSSSTSTLQDWTFSCSCPGCSPVVARHNFTRRNLSCSLVQLSCSRRQLYASWLRLLHQQPISQRFGLLAKSHEKRTQTPILCFQRIGEGNARTSSTGDGLDLDLPLNCPRRQAWK